MTVVAISMFCINQNIRKAPVKSTLGKKLYTNVMCFLIVTTVRPIKNLIHLVHFILQAIFARSLVAVLVGDVKLYPVFFS